MLTDIALEDVIRTQASGHRIAIAMRQEISAVGSDLMIDTADVAAISCLINELVPKSSKLAFWNFGGRRADLERIPHTFVQKIGPEANF